MPGEVGDREVDQHCGSAEAVESTLGFLEGRDDLQILSPRVGASFGRMDFH